MRWRPQYPNIFWILWAFLSGLDVTRMHAMSRLRQPEDTLMSHGTRNVVPPLSDNHRPFMFLVALPCKKYEYEIKTSNCRHMDVSENRLDLLGVTIISGRPCHRSSSIFASLQTSSISSRRLARTSVILGYTGTRQYKALRSSSRKPFRHSW